MLISLTKTADRYLPESPARLSFIPSRRFLSDSSRAITATRRRPPRRGTTDSIGDTAWKDEDGYYWYVGRTDDVIKSSGYRIGPFEIESVLTEHPSVLECAVTGLPDPIRGNVVKATIVLKPGFEGSEELKKELQTYVKKETAPYKYPRVIEFVDSLPKTVNGKIRRTEIRANDLRNLK